RPPLVGLVISLASPTYAQQKDVADPQTTQKINAILKAYAEAENNNDGAAVAALFTRDAVFVAPEGPIIGRQAIQKWYTNLYQWWHPKNSIHKVDGNAVHLIGMASVMSLNYVERTISLASAAFARLIFFRISRPEARQTYFFGFRLCPSR